MFVKMRNGSLLNTDNVTSIDPTTIDGVREDGSRYRTEFNSCVTFNADQWKTKLYVETVDEIHEAIRAEACYLHQLTHNG